MVVCTPKRRKWTTFSVSLVLILLGILLVSLWSGLVRMIIKQELSLDSSGNVGYKMWKETPIPMYLQFYLFNWTNPNDIHNLSIKPKFEECGPYTYYEHHVRENISINDNNTITFFTKRTWKFLPEKSNGSLLDVITTLNPVVVTMASLVRYKHYLVRLGVNFFMEEKKINLTISKTVDEFLFAGYNDSLLDLAHKLNISGFNVPFTKFGWFVDRNNSIEYDGVFNMFNGGDSIEKLGLLNTWNYVKRVSYFPGHCGDVNGTTGELWYPPHDDASVDLFATDLCSTVQLHKGGEYTLHGIEGHKYMGTESVFDNGTKYPEMKCFVTKGEKQASGVRNVSLCKFGAPALVSYPHFYQADPVYINALDGMKPDKSKHEVFLALEPSTGLPLKVQASFQINLQVDPLKGIRLLENVRSILMPSFWFKQTAELSEDLASQVKILLVLPAAGQYTGCGIIAIGLLVTIVGSIITYRKGWNESEEEQLLNQSAH